MSINKNKYSIFSIVLSAGTPIALFSYGQIKKAMRPALECAGQKNCVDLRGLDELPILFGLWIVLSAVAVLLAIQAGKANEAQAKKALWISSTSVVLAILVITIGIITN